MLLLKEISFSYNPTGFQKPLFDQLNLKVEKGSFFVLLGPLGSGKSTLVRLLLGLVNFEQGEYWFNGEKFSEKHRKLISVVFENVEDHFVGLSIEEDLSFSPRFLGFSPEETRMVIEEALKLVGLNKPLSTLIESLSAGEKQRLALAGALTKKPLLLVSDESTAYLDPQLRIKINQVFLKLKKKGLTIFHTTHFLEEAFLSDYLGILKEGKIEVFRPAEILLNLEYFSEIGVYVPRWLFRVRKQFGKESPFLLTRQSFLEVLCSMN